MQVSGDDSGRTMLIRVLGTSFHNRNTIWTCWEQNRRYVDDPKS